MSTSNRKAIAWISLIFFVIMSIMFSAQNAIVVNAQTAKNVSKEKVAIDFIKSVYSDFRTIKDNDDFDKAIQEQVSEKAESFKQLLKDRKYINEQDDLSFNTEEHLISDEYKKPKVVFEDENSASLFIEAEYQYKEEYAKGPNVKAEDNEDLTSGIQVFYKVNMVKENGTWKIKDLQSNDLTAGVMFPECIYNTNEWENSATVKKNSVKSLYNSQQKKEGYNVKEILDRRKQEGEISKSDQDKINEKGSIESKVVAVERHGKFHKMYAKPLRNYQNKWWNKRNSKYKNWDSMGGDCTNYASQVLHAGGAPYDKTGKLRWYAGNTTWIRVVELRNYLLKNTYTGPFGKKVSKRSSLTCGDLIQLGNSHTVVIYKGGMNDPYVTAHTSNYKGKFIKRYGTSGTTNILVKGYYD